MCEYCQDDIHADDASTLIRNEVQTGDVHGDKKKMMTKILMHVMPMMDGMKIFREPSQQ